MRSFIHEFMQHAPGADTLAENMLRSDVGMPAPISVSARGVLSFWGRNDHVPSGLAVQDSYGLGGLRGFDGTRSLAGLAGATTAAADFLPGLKQGHQWTMADFTGGSQVDPGDIRPGGGGTQGRQWAENMRAAIDANNAGRDWCLTGTTGYRGIKYSGPYNALPAAQDAWAFLTSGDVQAQYPNLPGVIAQYDAAIRAALDQAAGTWDYVLSGLPPCGRIQVASQAKIRVDAFEKLRVKLDAIIALAKSVRDDKAKRDAAAAQAEVNDVLAVGAAKDAGVAAGDSVLANGGSVSAAADAAAAQAAVTASASGASAIAAAKAAADAKAGIINKYAGLTDGGAMQAQSMSSGSKLALGIGGAVVILGIVYVMKRK